MRKTKTMIYAALLLACMSAMPVMANNTNAETVGVAQIETGIAPRAQLMYGWGLYPDGNSATAHSRSFVGDGLYVIDSIGVKIVSTRTDGTTKTVKDTLEDDCYCEVKLTESMNTEVEKYTSTHTFKSYLGTTVETVTKGPDES